MISLRLDPVTDNYAREAFKVVQDSWTKEPFINSNFKFFEIEFTQSGTFKVAHQLGFVPLDVIQSSLTGAGALTWNYATFNVTDFSITVTGACIVRAFVGAYKGSV